MLRIAPTAGVGACNAVQCMLQWRWDSTMLRIAPTAGVGACNAVQCMLQWRWDSTMLRIAPTAGHAVTCPQSSVAPERYDPTAGGVEAQCC
jgi:hypothetical protein